MDYAAGKVVWHRIVEVWYALIKDLMINLQETCSQRSFKAEKEGDFGGDMGNGLDQKVGGKRREQLELKHL